MPPTHPLETAIKRGGGLVVFARSLAVTHQAVSAWRKRGAVPFDKAVTIEALYGVPRETLVNARTAAAYLAPSLSGQEVL